MGLKSEKSLFLSLDSMFNEGGETPIFGLISLEQYQILQNHVHELNTYINTTIFLRNEKYNIENIHLV